MFFNLRVLFDLRFQFVNLALLVVNLLLLRVHLRVEGFHAFHEDGNDPDIVDRFVTLRVRADQFGENLFHFLRDEAELVNVGEVLFGPFRPVPIVGNAAQVQQVIKGVVHRGDMGFIAGVRGHYQRAVDLHIGRNDVQMRAVIEDNPRFVIAHVVVVKINVGRFSITDQFDMRLSHTVQTEMHTVYQRHAGTHARHDKPVLRIGHADADVAAGIESEVERGSAGVDGLFECQIVVCPEAAYAARVAVVAAAQCAPALPNNRKSVLLSGGQDGRPAIREVNRVVGINGVAGVNAGSRRIKQRAARSLPLIDGKGKGHRARVAIGEQFDPSQSAIRARREGLPDVRH